jgi:hypothetical protein
MHVRSPNLIGNHFNLERHLTDRQTFKLNRTAALEEWRQFATWRLLSKDLQCLLHVPLTKPRHLFGVH